MRSNKEMMSAAAAYILGLSPVVKVKGSTKELRVFTEVLESSRGVYSLLNGGSTIEALSEALADKSKKARTFKATFGQAWPF